jgi:lysophospholipase L1-like esterase
MGDSLTDYRSAGGTFIHVLQRRCPESTFDNYGKGGEMTNQMRRRFARQLFGPNKPSYSHVVVFGGVNDLYSDKTAHRTNPKIQADLLQMYQLAREAGAQVVALTVAPWGGFKRYFSPARAETTRALNRWIQAQEGASVDAVVDTVPLLSCGNAERLCPRYVPPFNDGLHFGKAGHEVLGEALWNRVFADCR